MNVIDSPRVDKPRRRLSGRPPMRGLYRVSATAARTPALLLPLLVCLALGSQMLRADTPLEVNRAGSGPVEGAGAHAAGGARGPMISSLMRRSGQSYLERLPENPEAGPGQFQGRPMLVPGGANAYGQVAGREVRPTRNQPVVAFAAQQEPTNASPSPGGPAGAANPFLEEEETGRPAGVPGIEHRPIGSLTTNTRCSEGDVPANEARARFVQPGELPEGPVLTRQWPGLQYEYEASWLYHRPLYFEEVNLERYGYMNCDHRCNGIPAALVQPVLSGAHFFATIPALPYKMAVHPPRECMYTLGYYRPGDCVPYQINWLPLQLRAGVIEATVATGLVFAIP